MGDKKHSFTFTEIRDPKVRYFKVDNGAIFLSVIDDEPENKAEHTITLYLCNPATQIAMGVSATPLYHLREVNEGFFEVDEEKGMVDVDETINEMIRSMLEEDGTGEIPFASALVMLDMVMDYLEEDPDDMDYDYDEDDDYDEDAYDEDEGEYDEDIPLPF